MKITEYPNSAVALAAGDLFDVSKLISPGIYESQSVDWDVMVSEMEDDFDLGNNISGTDTQTLRHNGTTWVANSNITNDGSKVGVGASAALTYLLNLRESNAEANANMLWLRNVNGGTGTDGHAGIAFTALNSANLGARIYHHWTGVNSGDERLTMQIGNAALVDVLTIQKTSGSKRRVGINTLSPSTSLHIVGDSSEDMFRVDSNTVNSIIHATSSGRVGINRSAPGAKLQIADDTPGESALFSLYSPDLNKEYRYFWSGTNMIHEYYGISWLTLRSSGNTLFTTDPTVQTGMTIFSPGSESNTVNILEVVGTNAATNKRFFVAASGNAGVGLDGTPGAKFHIVGVGNTDATYSLRVDNTGTNNVFVVRDDNNVGIGTDTFGANAAGVLGIKNRPEPTTAPADIIQVYSVDSDDNTATLGLYLEQAVEAIGTFTASHKIKVKINGGLYHIELDAV